MTIFDKIGESSKSGSITQGVFLKAKDPKQRSLIYFARILNCFPESETDYCLDAFAVQVVRSLNCLAYKTQVPSFWPIGIRCYVGAISGVSAARGSRGLIIATPDNPFLSMRLGTWSGRAGNRKF